MFGLGGIGTAGKPGGIGGDASKGCNKGLHESHGACKPNYVNHDNIAKSGVSAGDSYSAYNKGGYPTGSSHGGYGYSSYDSGDDFMSNVARFNKLNNLDQKALSDLNKPENKDAKWAVDYMCSLYCAGANNPDHQGYYLFVNAYSYALSKSIDTSKSFFAHYMDSLVNQGATNPSHKFYYIFENAHKYALDNQSKLPHDRWAKNYMDSLVNQGGSNSSHPAYYLFSNAHTYALSKSADTSKTFFAHYMDSLVNQGASNPQNPHYYMFSNAYAYALKNQ